MGVEAGATADLRAERVYPFGPMPGDQWLSWHPDATRRRERATVDPIRAREIERAREWARGEAAALRPALRSYDGPALVTPTSSVAAGTSDGATAELQRLRRERFTMRAASQELVRVKVVEKAARSWYALDDESGELVKIDAAPKMVRQRLGLKLCGRAVGMDLPAAGQSQAGRKVERAGAVSVALDGSGRAALQGIHRCGSVWACPVCAYHIARERGEELQRVFDAATAQGWAAYLLTLTVRHFDGMGLERLRKAVSGIWRQIRQSRAWRNLCAELGYLGDVRALEVTHGANGWHPHLHLVVWFPRELDARSQARLRACIYREWARRVERDTGERPSRAHGCHLQRVHKRADYVAKLGIAAELVSSHGKTARGGSRSPWQILSSWTRKRRGEEADLWREWTEAMHGARQLTWSGAELRALRAEVAPGDPTDAELAEREAERGVVVAQVPRQTWERLDAALPGWSHWVLEKAEAYGGRGLVALIKLAESDYNARGGRPPEWWPYRSRGNTTHGGGDAG